MDTIVVATQNSGKLREFGRLLSSTGWQVIGLRDLSIDIEYEEAGSSFGENARLKAISYSHETRYPVLADDSGLEVAALGGRPGIYSARYAGIGASDSDRISKLLQEMEQCGGGREARFVCALALARDGVLLLEAQGECFGEIAHEPRGTNGFGYDPIFLFAELGKTFAELTDSEKNLYSHRARAAHSLMTKMKSW